MKVQNKRLSFMSLFLATALGLGLIQTVHAQDLLDDTDDLLQDGSAMQMDDINIDGKLSPSERIRKQRERLEERNKIMVEKKIEDIRVKQEVALSKKLNDAFTKGLNNLNEDKVEVKQAAPVAPQPVQPIIIQQTAPVVETKVEPKEVEPKVEKLNSITLTGASQSIKGTDLDIGSKISIGASVQTLVTPNISVGLGLGYTTLSATDVANTYGSTYYCYNSTNCGGREMSFNKLSVDANSKFFIIAEGKLRPYVGAGLMFNRTSLKYDSAANYYYYNNYTSTNSDYSDSYLSGQAKLGADIEVSGNIGLNLELSYAKSLTSSDSSNVTNSNDPDQARLQNVSNAIKKGDVTSIGAGLVIKF